MNVVRRNVVKRIGRTAFTGWQARGEKTIAFRSDDELVSHSNLFVSVP